MTTELERCTQAPPTWRIGRYRFERWPRAASGPGSRGRWGCGDGMRGVGGHRTPVGAWLSLWRWIRKDAANRKARGW